MAEGFKLPRWLSFGLAFPLFILNAWVLLGVIKYLHTGQYILLSIAGFCFRISDWFFSKTRC